MVVTTSGCGDFGHPEFTLEADERLIPERFLHNVVPTIERMVATGSIFKPGQTVQLGWMVTQVRQATRTCLTLVEPDMKSFPINHVPGITRTLRQMMVQLFTLDSVSLRDQMKIPSILQSVIVCNRYSDVNFMMTRSASSSASDSGWFVGCAGEGHDHNDPKNLRLASLYEAFLHQRGIENFVSLPVGSEIIINRTKGMLIARNGKELDVAPGSFLDEWLSRVSKRA